MLCQLRGSNQPFRALFPLRSCLASRRLVGRAVLGGSSKDRRPSSALQHLLTLPGKRVQVRLSTVGRVGREHPGMTRHQAGALGPALARPEGCAQSAAPRAPPCGVRGSPDPPSAHLAVLVRAPCSSRLLTLPVAAVSTKQGRGHHQISIWKAEGSQG